MKRIGWFVVVFGMLAGLLPLSAQAEQMETMLESLDKAAEAERQLSFRITDKNAELDDVLRSIGEWVQQKVAGMSR